MVTFLTLRPRVGEQHQDTIGNSIKYQTKNTNDLNKIIKKFERVTLWLLSFFVISKLFFIKQIFHYIPISQKRTTSILPVRVIEISTFLKDCVLALREKNPSFLCVNNLLSQMESQNPFWKSNQHNPFPSQYITLERFIIILVDSCSLLFYNWCFYHFKITFFSDVREATVQLGFCGKIFFGYKNGKEFSGLVHNVEYKIRSVWCRVNNSISFFSSTLENIFIKI